MDLSSNCLIFRRLRYSAILLLLNSGAEPFAVQKLAGHSDVRLTQPYEHVQAEALRRAAGVPDRIGLETMRQEMGNRRNPWQA